MKVLVMSMLVAVVAAEPPISNSYLPPPASSAGYPQGPQGPGFPAGGPSVVTARSFGQGYHGANGNGFARNGLHGHNAQEKFGPAHGHGGHGHHGYDQNGAAGRSFLENSDEPANYNFGYMVNDVIEGTDFGHQEERREDEAHGHYHVVLPDGRKQTVNYEAGARGFKPQISYEDTEDLTRSNGYDSNANTRGNFQNGGHNYKSSGHNGRSNGY